MDMEKNLDLNIEAGDKGLTYFLPMFPFISIPSVILVNSIHCSLLWKILCPSLGKRSPKWRQNRVFWIFWEILSLVFPGSNLKWKLVKFWLLSYGPKFSQPIKLQDSLKCGISRKKWFMRFVCGMQIIEFFCKLILSFWVCVVRHAQSTQNKFALSLQYLQ